MITGYTIFSSIIKKETADEKFWRYYIRRNILKAVTILISISDDLGCMICGELSLNYNSKASLAHHIRFGHFHQTEDYILENIVTKEPDELEEMMDNE
ncbi:MAG: hypothetical protein ISR80_04515 [Nitrosopumilus sp.]|nr:hypothetical protein [Nitrosopumilus sp.]